MTHIKAVRNTERSWQIGTKLVNMHRAINAQLHSLDKTHLHFYEQASLTLLSIFSLQLTEL